MFVSVMLVLFSFIIVVEYVLDTAILLHKLEAAFKKAAPVQAQVLQPTEESEIGFILEPALQDESLYSTPSNFRENGRTKLVRAENEMMTNENT